MKRASETKKLIKLLQQIFDMSRDSERHFSCLFPLLIQSLVWLQFPSDKLPILARNEAIRRENVAFRTTGGGCA